MEVAVTTDVGTGQRVNDDAWCHEQLHRNVTLLAVADGFGRPHDVLALIHISEPTRLLRNSYAVFCLKKNTTRTAHQLNSFPPYPEPLITI